ncbi:LacI family DNA-binding transcriptional regulator [Nibricoccus sp. IMCC34717]|uniref:LacI family DNA-binding transcriptional regulator n=1 Tax=Nibricoccus sp. IMCC34717 TaxID=3034021 RepID=UPI003850A081
MPQVTMAMIAKAAGVSKNAVSLALRADPQIPSATRRRIEKAARDLGYVRNPVVAQLMAELRRGKAAGYRRTLALVNANVARDAFRAHPTIPAYVAGCRRRAEASGYRLDEFWMHDPDFTASRALRIWRARGIRGVLVVGMMRENRFPEALRPLWDDFACVVTGVRTREPTLHFCCVDHHALVLQAFEQAWALGYRAPALVVDHHIDSLVDGRFSAAMHYAQAQFPVARVIPAFLEVDECHQDPAPFQKWVKRHKPDVILTLYTAVKTWLAQAGLRVPDDLGLVQLERRKGNLDWSGMDQHNDLCGEAAVDRVISLLHLNESGVPEFPRATLISGSWSEGATTRRQPVAAHG